MLTILREGEDEPLKVTVVRDVIRVQSVKYRVENDIGYIRIASFSEQTMEGLEQAIDKIEAEVPGDKLKGFVLDLRGNPGGLLDQAVLVSDAFLERGEIVSTRGRHAEEVQRFSARAGDLADGKPVIVLVNGGSASASEIVAGALQDHRRATVLGTRSFGKGSVQTIIPIGRSGAIRLTTARYYTPAGRSIQAQGHRARHRGPAGVPEDVQDIDDDERSGAARPSAGRRRASDDEPRRGAAETPPPTTPTRTPSRAEGEEEEEPAGALVVLRPGRSEARHAAQLRLRPAARHPGEHRLPASAEQGIRTDDSPARLQLRAGLLLHAGHACRVRRMRSSSSRGFRARRLYLDQRIAGACGLRQPIARARCRRTISTIRSKAGRSAAPRRLPSRRCRCLARRCCSPWWRRSGSRWSTIRMAAGRVAVATIEDAVAGGDRKHRRTTASPPSHGEAADPGRSSLGDLAMLSRRCRSFAAAERPAGPDRAIRLRPAAARRAGRHAAARRLCAAGAGRRRGHAPHRHRRRRSRAQPDRHAERHRSAARGRDAGLRALRVEPAALGRQGAGGGSRGAPADPARAGRLSASKIPASIRCSSPADRRPRDDLLWNLGRMTSYAGVMNYMGARFSRDENALVPFLGEIGERGLYYLDDGTTSGSLHLRHR